jgi:hypothetical protein
MAGGGPSAEEPMVEGASPIRRAKSDNLSSETEVRPLHHSLFGERFPSRRFAGEVGACGRLCLNSRNEIVWEGS